MPSNCQKKPSTLSAFLTFLLLLFDLLSLPFLLGRGLVRLPLQVLGADLLVARSPLLPRTITNEIGNNYMNDKHDLELSIVNLDISFFVGFHSHEINGKVGNPWI